MAKKYFWIKLKKDFFKRHDVRVVEGMPNGKDYILFYLKLLVESVSHEGELRFSDTIPYNDEMLATITNTNIDVVRSAMKVFIELEMIEMLEDRTIYMSEIDKMIGSETEWAKKKREYRASLLDNQRTSEDNVRQELDKEKELELEIEKDIGEKRTRFIPPTIDDVSNYALEKGYFKFDADKFVDYYSSKGWYVGKNKMKDWKAAVRNWNRNNSMWDKSKASSGGSSLLDELARI